MAAVLLCPGLAAAEVLRTECAGCETLRDFGNYGAAQFYRAVGPMGPAVLNDRIWVVNPVTGRQVFVDLDTPITLVYFLGAPIPVPDLLRTEINATWGDGSVTEIWILPNEVIGSMAEALASTDAAGTPPLSPELLDRLPGFGSGGGWHHTGSVGSMTSTHYGAWSFWVRYDSYGRAVVSVYECAYMSGC
jgi:hypothetical protein